MVNLYMRLGSFLGGGLRGSLNIFEPMAVRVKFPIVPIPHPLAHHMVPVLYFPYISSCARTPLTPCPSHGPCTVVPLHFQLCPYTPTPYAQRMVPVLYFPYISGCAGCESLESDFVVAEISDGAEDHSRSPVLDVEDGFTVIHDLRGEILGHRRTDEQQQQCQAS